MRIVARCRIQVRLIFDLFLFNSERSAFLITL